MILHCSPLPPADKRRNTIRQIYICEHFLVALFSADKLGLRMQPCSHFAVLAVMVKFRNLSTGEKGSEGRGNEFPDEESFVGKD